MVKITLVNLSTGVPIVVVGDTEIAIAGKGWDVVTTAEIAAHLVETKVPRVKSLETKTTTVAAASINSGANMMFHC